MIWRGLLNEKIPNLNKGEGSQFLKTYACNSLEYIEFYVI